ncbi:hypothetical protein [Exiguobacterium sp. R-39]|uniref:hypothetical protein n=1 Tax=Exiguobacterium sp. R-39 TaxID=3416708 RepID=UPI003CF2AC08
MKLPYKFYRNLFDFDHDKIAQNGHVDITLFDIKRSMLTVGQIPWNKGVPLEILKWKIKIIEAHINALESSVKIKNIKYLESTEKVTISFYIGMTFAQLISEKLYNIKHLYHLNSHNDERFEINKLAKSPDLIGINEKSLGAKPFLIEAKGSSISQKKFPYARVEAATKQLDSVNNIKFTHNNNIYFKKDINKLVIATHPLKSEELITQIIDPVGEGELDIVVNSDVSLLNYYFTIMSLIENSKEEPSIYVINDIEFQISYIKDLNLYIGLSKKIYTILHNSFIIRYYENYLSVDGIYMESIEVLNRYDEQIDFIQRTNTTDDFSIGKDGVLLFSNLKDINK